MEALNMWNWETGVAVAVVAIVYSSAHLILFFGLSESASAGILDTSVVAMADPVNVD